MAHGYKGLFNLSFTPDFDSIENVVFYNAENSHLTSNDVNLAKIDGKIVFTDLKKIYSYVKEEGDFVPNNHLDPYLSGYMVKALKQDREGNIWYFKDIESGVLRKLEDGSYKNIALPFIRIRDKFVKGFEFVYPIDDENVFFGAEKGFIHYNPSIVKDYDYMFESFIRTMRSFNPDSAYKVEPEIEPIVLEFNNNDIEFEFAANDFQNADKILFASFLQGHDESWTDWQLKNSRDFTNLYEGEYVFKVKSKNIYGTVSEEVSSAFKVKPPMRRTLIAYFIYGIIILFALFIFVLVMRRRFEKAKIKSENEQLENFKRKEDALQREALKADKEVIRIRNEKLRAEMKQKDKELANATMQTLQKNRMLITLRDELKKLAAISVDPGHLHEVKHLVRRINKEIDSENQWAIFETHFENVHEEFLKRLKTAYPDLTPRELKLCAYLRLNISSKEISLLMNISTRGVEISRYRLRKKLRLSRETNLTEFILSF
jgi:DNA-binding CsgD family transcriptional regulator